MMCNPENASMLFPADAPPRLFFPLRCLLLFPTCLQRWPWAHLALGSVQREDNWCFPRLWLFPVKESEPSPPARPLCPRAYEKLEDDAGIRVVVFEIDCAGLLQVDCIHERGCALICVGGDVVTPGGPLGPAMEQEPSSLAGTGVAHWALCQVQVSRAAASRGGNPIFVVLVIHKSMCAPEKVP